MKNGTKRTARKRRSSILCDNSFGGVLFTAISINVVGSKQKAIRQDRKVIWEFFLINSSKSAMPRPFSEDLHWRAIWMKEMLGYQVDKVAAALRMPPRTIEHYILKVLNFGEVKPNTIGTSINSVAMHPHVEFFITKAVLLKAPRKDTT